MKPHPLVRIGCDPDAIERHLPELVALRQWVVWRPAMREGKLNKIPVNARSGGGASSTDPRTWSTFAHAVAAFRRQPQRYGGAGFVFSSGDPFTGIDLDHAIDLETGEVAGWADAILTRFPRAYAELSPSGTGIKLFVRSRMPEGAKHKRTGLGADRKGAVELYDRARYFTVTGRVLPR